MKLLQDIAAYYSGKLQEHGATPRGVDWNSADGQRLRFEQLTRLFSGEDFSVVDLGCGYGAFLDYLLEQQIPCEYHGYDLSESMIETARSRHPGQGRFFLGSQPEETVDFIVASGIFNVRMEHNDEAWTAYLEETLDQMHAHSRRGFAFNCLTSYADRKRADLYYPNPGQLFDRCRRMYANNVALLHDYGLWEFTILVRKIL